MNIYTTIAAVGRHAPLIRARTQIEAIGLLRRFEAIQQAHGVACKLGISGVFQNWNNPVEWQKDYADTAEPLFIARSNGKPSDKVNSFYRAAKPAACSVVNHEYAALFAAQHGESK